MQAQGLEPGSERGKMNRRLEKDTNTVHKPDKEKDTGHKRVRDMVTDMVPDMVPDMVMGIGKGHRLDMLLGLKRASELAPAPAQMSYIPLNAGQKSLYCLTANL